MNNLINVKDKVLLFDFDGTIVETEILAKRIIDAYFVEKGLPSDPHFGDLIVGRTWKLAVENMHEYAKGLKIDLEAPEVLIREFKERYRAKFKEGVSLIPGFKELLPELKAKSKLMAIVTGSERHEVEQILSMHGLNEHFGPIWGFGDYEQSKPHPSPYLTATKATGSTKNDIWVFEDSAAGMESAHLAGLDFIQIGHESHAKTKDPRAKHFIKDWTELRVR